MPLWFIFDLFDFYDGDTLLAAAAEAPVYC